MSLYLLATGNLIADPVERTGKSGSFVTAVLRCSTDDDAVLVSIIAFNDAAETLLVHRHGSALAVSGRAKLTSWTGKDNTEKHGISLVVEQIASASAARRADAERRQNKNRGRNE